MATTASRWMTVGPYEAPTGSDTSTIGVVEQNINAGFTVHVLDYKNMKTLVAIISEFQALSFTQQLNDPGTGSITFDEDDPGWSLILNSGESRRTLLNREYVFEIWDRDTPRFAWIADTVTNSGTDEARSVTISGPGTAGVLKWAVINRPGWPTKVPIIKYEPSDADPANPYPIYRANSSNDKIPAFLWRFPVKWPSMRMWYTVFRAAQRRGLLKFVTLMFTATKDSAKTPWQDISTIEEVATKEGYQPETPSENLLDFLNDCTGQDYSKWFGQRLEWLMLPGFNLDVRPTIGTNKAKTVRFYQGNIISVDRTRAREGIYNRVMAVDVDGNETNVTNQKSVAVWNLREQRNETNKNVTDPKLRANLADRRLVQSKDEKDEWSVKVHYDNPGRVPFRSYSVGDTIGFNVEFNGWTPVAKDTPTEYRVMAITLSLTPDSTVPDVELTLQSVMESKLIQIEREITQFLNNPRNVKISDIADVDDGTSNGSQIDKKKTLVFNPKTKKWEAVDVNETGGGGAGRVFIQKIDPTTQTGVTVTAGDFWLETYD